MKALGQTLLAVVVALTSLSAVSQRAREQGVNDTEIRIGNIMPYTGALKDFGSIGKAQAAYFDMINDRGGINGRKVRFISYDDHSDPTSALELTRRLVEQDEVLLMFGSFGTLGNLSARQYLNEKQIPQLFVASGDEQFNNPSVFPWTMGWQPPFRAEGLIYARYIQALYPGSKIVVLWQNDQFGRSLFKGLQEGLGDLARMIIVDIAYDVSDAYLDTHISILKRSGADIFVFAGVPTNAVQAIRIAANLNWHPVFILNDMASSIGTVLKPAGLENASGVISATFLKDVSDPAWKDDPATKAWHAFADRYLRGASKDDNGALYGFAVAETLAQVLKQCGDDLSRENVMRQAAALENYQPSALLPNIKVSTGPWDFRPIKNLRLGQFDGQSWQPIGEVLDTAFSDAKK
jgi:ABC-type branched-subunit amino acid transport system substrate-binding protein